MLAVPPALLEVLQLRAGATVGIAIKSGRLVVEPQRRPRYTLDESLAKCNRQAGAVKRTGSGSMPGRLAASSSDETRRNLARRA
jgi:antitoxin component of MazEF toxin-antitoxin module